MNKKKIDQSNLKESILEREEEKINKERAHILQT